MIEQDTVKLLRECDAGIKMGVDAIDDVVDYVSHPRLKKYLKDGRLEHEGLDTELQKLLAQYGDEGKEPSAMVKGMSWIKTTVKLKIKESDATIADLMTEGCHMGIKSLSRYLNQYTAADETSKNLCKRLIQLEEKLSNQMREFL